MILPRIYKKAKLGSIVVCDIDIAGDTITVSTGQLDGKMQDHHTLCKPKNIGRANETTPEEQAILEGKAKHAKKIKAGYTLDPSGEIVVMLPQKVKNYQNQKYNVIFPCWLSPKLNGVNGEFRLTVTPDSDLLEVHSRGGDTYPMLEHMTEDIIKVMKALDTCTLNGEIYKHDEYLQDITSAVKKHNDLTPDLEFHVFELPDNPLEFSLKRVTLQKDAYCGHVKRVPIIKAETHEDIETYFKACLVNGFEGIIIRNSKGVYSYNERSTDVFKYKLAEDAEFKIVGYNIDKRGHPVFICTTGEHEFKAKIKGTTERRLEIAKEADAWIGKWLTVEYEEFSKIGKPLKPVGISLRKCDSDGNPLV